jgi:hypothetical protein
VSDNPQPGLNEIHGSLTALLLPSLEGSDVLGAPARAVPVKTSNPTLPTIGDNSATAIVCRFDASPGA